MWATSAPAGADRPACHPQGHALGLPRRADGLSGCSSGIRHQSTLIRQAASRTWEDARAAARVLATATTLWPAARPMVSNAGRPTTRQARAERAHARQVRLAEARKLKKQTQFSAQATHSWMQVGSVTRCCWCLCRHSCLQPCTGIPVALRSWEECAVQHAHTPRRVLLHFHGRAESQEVLSAIVCMSCGAWSTAAVQRRHSLLLKPCRRVPSRAGQDVLSRVRRGLHPKAGGTPPCLCVNVVFLFGANFDSGSVREGPMHSMGAMRCAQCG